MLTGQVGPAKLLGRQYYGVQRCLDFMSDRRVKQLIYVAQQHVFIYLDFLGRLL